MTNRISTEAKNFIADNLPISPHDEITSANVGSIREQTAADNQPAIDYAKLTYPNRLRCEEIADINCLVIEPKLLKLENPKATLLYFFGGGYVLGSPEEDLSISAYIAAALGIRVISPFYRTSPEHPCPAAIDDGYAVYRTLIESTDPGRLLVMGESAGGNLALNVLLRAIAKLLPIAAGCVLLSPWCDLSHSGDTDNSNHGRDPTLTRNSVINYANLFAPDTPKMDPIVSPLFAEFDSRFPKTLITTGTRDLLLSQCVRLTKKMRNAKIQTELRVWEDMWHVFEFYPQIPESNESLKEISQFLECCLEN